METVLRVKRRKDEEPLDALVIACKRRKTSENLDVEDSSDSVTAVLKFAGTLKNQEDSIAEHLIKVPTKDELIAKFKKRTVDVTAKTRERTKQESRDNRFKVISCIRSIDSDNHTESADKKLTVIDVEDTTRISSLSEAFPSKDEEYVYDLYHTHTNDYMLIDQFLSVHLFEEDMVYDAYRDGEQDSHLDYESEDSNSEGNWRNDYPDSDHSHNSILEEDMRTAIGRVRLNSDEDSSSEDEGLVYGLCETDVENFGYKYAKFKAKVKVEMGDDGSSNSGISDSEYLDESDRDDCSQML